MHQGRLYPTISHHLITGETNRQELIALVGFQTRREILGTNSTPSFIAPLTNMFKNLHRLITYPILLALFWRQLGPAGQKNMFLPSVVETFTFNKYMNRRRTKKTKNDPLSPAWSFRVQWFMAFFQLAGLLGWSLKMKHGRGLGRTPLQSNIYIYICVYILLSLIFLWYINMKVIIYGFNRKWSITLKQKWYIYIYIFR